MGERKGKARAWSAARARAALVTEQSKADARRAADWPGDGVPTSMAVDERHLSKAYIDGWDAALNSSDPIGDREREWTRLGMSPQAKRKGAAKCLGFHCAQGGECPACDEAQAKRGKGKSGEGR